MSRFFFRCLFLALIFLFTSHPVFVLANEPVHRKVLALYDANKYPDPFYSPIHQHLEFALNHLGLDVVYRSYQSPFPDHHELDEYRGIVLWNRFPAEVLKAKPFCEWLDLEVVAGRKLAILEFLGVENANNGLVYPASCLNVLKRVGITLHGEFSDDPLYLEVTQKNPDMLEFERKLSFADELKYTLMRPARADVRVWLKMKRLDIEDSESSLVVTSSYGGYAHPGYVLFKNPNIDKVQWILNPFRFFAEAFSLEGIPVPDTNAINGRRILYTHIDGDGIFNVSRIDQKSFSGQIILDEILRRHERLPITASLITGYFDEKIYQGEHVKRLYRDILSLPHVEIGVHGYAHPLDWKKGTVALKIKDYSYDPRFEIEGALSLMRELVKELELNKGVDLYQWTGNCLPEPEHIAYAEEAHLLNINGGDSFFDDRHDSHANLWPLGRVAKGQRQIYSSFGNENLYTNLWQGPYYGYQQVIQSFVNTAGPPYLKPINIYYHFYSGEHMGSLTALKKVHDYALREPIIPIFTTEYVRIARDFFTTGIQKKEDGYLLTTSGHLRTLRYDGEDRFVDLRRSRGVLGFAHKGGSLYVHLGEKKIHEIYLTAERPVTNYLVESNFLIRGWRASPGEVVFSLKAWMDPQMVLGGFKPGAAYRLTDADRSLDAVAGQDGMILIDLPKTLLPGQWKDIRIKIEHL